MTPWVSLTYSQNPAQGGPCLQQPQEAWPGLPLGAAQAVSSLGFPEDCVLPLDSILSQHPERAPLTPSLVSYPVVWSWRPPITVSRSNTLPFCPTDLTSGFQHESLWGSLKVTVREVGLPITQRGRLPLHDPSVLLWALQAPQYQAHSYRIQMSITGTTGQRT